MATIDENLGNLVKEYFLDQANPLVNGVAIGYLPTDESAQILVFVDASAAECDRNDIDKAFDKIAPKQPHTLLHSSRFVGLQTPIGAVVSPYNPSRYNVPPVLLGTLGALVKAGAHEYILSSNHVLAHNGRVPDGTDVVTPGPLEDANIGALIGQRSHFVELNAPTWPLSGAPANLVDCALAEVAPGSVNAPLAVNPLPSPPQGTPPHPFAITKTGRVREISQSEVRVFDWHGYIDFSFGMYYFEKLMGTHDKHKIFAAPGDSGSLALDSGGQGVGLITARGYIFDPPDSFDAYVILICSLDSVRDQLAGLRGFPSGPITFWRHT